MDSRMWVEYLYIPMINEKVQVQFNFDFVKVGPRNGNETRPAGGGKADRIKRPMNAFMVSLYSH